MGQKTPNISIYIPSPGEEIYSASFKAGMQYLDSHDHTGAPTKGVKIPTDGIEDGAITPPKLSEEIFKEFTLTTTDATPTEGESISLAESAAAVVVMRFIAIDAATNLSIDGWLERGFHRPTGSSVTANTDEPKRFIGHNSASGTPTFLIEADTVNEAISLQAVGLAATTINWHVAYNILRQPEP